MTDPKLDEFLPNEATARASSDAAAEEKKREMRDNPRLAEAVEALSASGAPASEDVTPVGPTSLSPDSAKNVLAVGSEAASGYVPPTTIPPESIHKTFEMKKVKIAADIDPRLAQTQPGVRIPGSLMRAQPRAARLSPAWVFAATFGVSIAVGLLIFRQPPDVTHEGRPTLVSDSDEPPVRSEREGQDAPREPVTVAAQPVATTEPNAAVAVGSASSPVEDSPRRQANPELLRAQARSSVLLSPATKASSVVAPALPPASSKIAPKERLFSDDGE